MKQVFIYTSPEHKFDEESSILMNVQIENSKRFGWWNKDILIYTNFDFKCQGIKSTVIPDIYCPHDKTSNKILVIVYLLENKMLPYELLWYHDIDSYQEALFSEEALYMSSDLALTSYGYKEGVNCGVFFFYPSALPIFKLWVKKMRYTHTRADEKTMRKIIERGQLQQNQYQILNSSYNFSTRFFKRNLEKLEGERLKIIHFHPEARDLIIKDRAMDIAVNNNLISNELKNIFNKYGIS